MAGIIRTLGISPEAIVKMVDDASLTKSFLSDTTYLIGTLVKLIEDGSVTVVTAATDVVFGVVISSEEKSDRTKCTVQTSFQMLSRGLAAGGVTAAQLLSTTGIEAEATDPELKMKFKTAVAGDYVTAIALTTAADTEEVEVGILRTPFRLS